MTKHTLVEQELQELGTELEMQELEAVQVPVAVGKNASGNIPSGLPKQTSRIGDAALRGVAGRAIADGRQILALGDQSGILRLDPSQERDILRR